MMNNKRLTQLQKDLQEFIETTRLHYPSFSNVVSVRAASLIGTIDAIKETPPTPLETPKKKDQGPQSDTIQA